MPETPWTPEEQTPDLPRPSASDPWPSPFPWHPPIPADFVPPRPAPQRLWLHILLFGLTIVTTVIAGAVMDGADLLADPFLVWRGIPFSFCLMLILGVHESAHYLFSRRNGLAATLPYFIPAPTPVGTMGAVIRIKSPILDRRALLEIGASGPLAGFIVSLPVTIIGLRLSKTVATLPAGEEGISLGSSLLFSLLEKVFSPAGSDSVNLLLHPVAFAGWFGLFVTAMNLIPVGQLDGGHVVCALFAERHRPIALLSLLALIPLGIFLWPGWLIWALLLIIMGWRHPLPLDHYTPLSRAHTLVGWLALAVLVLTFTPAPFPAF